ncbi:MAG: SpoIIE family protein phosphatase [Oscillospiraceae bacterium]|nr:SpoIIE family protein phosphatase [Oscillospiraceae bacterium]
MKKTSIRKKVSSLTTRISLASAILIGIVTVSGLLILRMNMFNVSSELGDAAAHDSQEALEERMTGELMTLAINKAQISDDKLRATQNAVKMIAYGAEEIAQNPDNYLPVYVGPPDERNRGTMTAQLLRADESLTMEGAAIMNNVHTLLLNIALNGDNITIDYVGTEEGYMIVVDADSVMPAVGGFDPRERGWYKLAKENGTLSWTDVYSDASGRGLAITCSMPFYNLDGSLVGVAGIGSLLDNLSNIVIESTIGETGYAFMVNERGQVIISKEVEEDESGAIIREDLLNSSNPDLARIAGEMVNRQTGIERIIIDGREVFIAYAPLDTLPWTLVTVMDVSEAIKPAVESKERIISFKDSALTEMDIIIVIVLSAFLVVLILIVLVFGYVSQRFSNTLTEPITQLETGVQIIAAGNLKKQLDIKTGDEIEALSQSVNKMAHDLSEYIDNLQKITAEKERIGAELTVATQIQASMLPCIFPAFPDRVEFDIYATMEPAKEVGGDFYDFFLVDENTLAVVMADVSGKGVPAALFMVIAKTLIKNTAQYGKSPKAVFETVNTILCENNEENMFVTAFMGYLDIKSGKFTYVNAGHNAPVLNRKNADCDWLPIENDFVLAGFDGMTYEESEIMLEPGDILYLYTDGVTEAVNPDNDLFSDEKLLEVCGEYKKLLPKELLAAVKVEIDKFADGAEQADDITMLALYMREDYEKETAPRTNELVVEAKTDNLYAVLDFIKDALNNHNENCTEEKRNLIMISAEEIYVNIANYAYEGMDGTAIVRINPKESFSITFEDEGKPYNPLNRKDPNIEATADERGIGGLGVFMTKTYMDNVNYEYKDNKNTFTMDIEI